jgi:hypothetical protein
MKPTRSSAILLLNSIIWASLMIAIAIYFKGTTHSESLFIYMIGGWYFSGGLLKCVFNINQQNHCERQLCRKLFKSK